MKNKSLRLFKINDEFQLSEVVLTEPYILGDALYGESCLAQISPIRYQPLLDNLKANGIHSTFVLLVDEEGGIKELPLNFIGSFLSQDQLLGDVYVCKVGKTDFVDMLDREYDILKTQLLGLIDIITEELSKTDADDLEVLS